ncbi:MAG TPA: ABC transporter ATP-binding protein [Planctomycetia bacterium]|nr:ABC transporter ATP-binding protein [Planctomycetia bacterium]
MIEVEGLTKRFALPDGGEVLAVDDLRFRVAAGEVYGLLGPNGAGKTTTIRMLLGLLEPTRGHASIAGYRSSVAPDEVKRRVGLVSANAGIYPGLTVREFLLFFADIYGVPPREAEAVMNRLADRFGFAALLGRACATLSTGQRQRVHFARALMHDPPVLLLDEPTTGVDVLGSQAVVEYVELLRSEGKAAILCTHRLEEAERLCTRVGLLHRGRLVSEGTLDVLRERSGTSSLVEMFLELAGVGAVLAAPAEGGGA